MRRLMFLAAMLFFALSACAKNSDIVTQTVVNPDKIPVTVLVKHAFSIQTFEKTAELKFPNLDLIQVGNFTSNMGTAEYDARLEHDDLTDLVMTWPLEVGKQYWSERLLDLSGLPCTGNYVTARLDNISKGGKLYYLPGPSQIRGIVYNKTLFEELGLSVPTNFDEFITLCHQIEATGIRSLQLGLANPEVLDTAFVGFSFDNGFGKPKDIQWLNEYNKGIGQFGAQFRPALDTFQTLIDNGILKPQDLSLNYSHREQMLFTRQCAMIEDSVLLARMGSDYNGCTDEFALMPFFTPGSENSWVRLYPICYIGVNQHVTEDAAKHDLIMQLLDFISTLEGQAALVGDTDAMYSALKNAPPPNAVEIQDLLPALEHGRCAVFPTLKNAQTALRHGLASMVAGSASVEDVIQMVDTENLNPPKPMPPTVYGTATEDFSLIDTGNFVTDAMRSKTGCEIALFLDDGKDGQHNAKGLSARLYQGDITSVDIQRILPDLKQTDTYELCRITMTGANLLSTLEYSIPVFDHLCGWFYYFSGLRMTYDPTAVPGSRILKITDESGNAIDPTRLYSIAIMENTVPNDAIASCQKTGFFLPDVLKDAMNLPLSPANDHRFTLPS